MSPERAADVAVEHVSHAYDGVPVLEDVTVSFEAGTVTAVVGPNGSGKSTLLSLLAGVRSPEAGTVSRSGGDDAAGGGFRLGGGRAVGWLPQRFEPRPAFTVRETLAFYAGLVDGGPAVTALLERVGLTGVADRRVAALSGGMRRLLGVAVAAVGDPPLLVLDEPTSGLDPTMTVRVSTVLSDLAGDDRVVIVSSHDLDAVEATADRVLLLDHGRVQLDAPAAELLAALDVGSLADGFGVAVDAADGSTVRTEA